MLRVQIVCCLSSRFCSSEARPSQYGSGDDVEVRGGVGSVIVKIYIFRLVGRIQRAVLRLLYDTDLIFTLGR